MAALRALGLLGLLFWQAHGPAQPPVAEPAFLRYQRAIVVPAETGQACAVLDAAIFPHAAPSLADLRVFPAESGGALQEIPYVITMSQTATEATESARIVHRGPAEPSGLGVRFAFELEMPQRPYSEVVLQIAPYARDFVATAHVSGMDTLAGRSTALGPFTLFDLSSKHLSRDTTLRLVESSFRYLHVALTVKAERSGGPPFAPAMVLGAEVPPSRRSQVLYTTVADVTSVTHAGSHTEAVFQVPPRVPVERVSFELARGFQGSFSRDIHIEAVPSGDPSARASAGATQPDAAYSQGALERVSGVILRVHLKDGGQEVAIDRLSVPAILGANLQQAADVRVSFENGDEQPLPVASVRLEMRQRKLCFNRTAGTQPALFYGDATLSAPEYEYMRNFQPSLNTLTATLGPELPNPTFRDRPAPRHTVTEQHPELLWIALIAVISAIGMAGLRWLRSAAR